MATLARRHPRRSRCPTSASGRVPLPRGRLHPDAQPERRGPRRHPAVERGFRAAPARGTSRPRSPTSARRRTAATPTSTSTTASPAAATPAASTSRWPARRPSTTGRRRTKSRYKGLQLALNRPFRNGLMLKGAYTLSKAKDMTTSGEDGWVGLTWNHPLKYDDNFAHRGLRPDPRRPAGLPLRAAVLQELARAR